MRLKSVLCALAVLTLAACGPKEKVTETQISAKASVSTVAANSPERIVITVTANKPWKASSDASWLSLSPESGEGSGEIVATASENAGPAGEAAKERKAAVTIKCDDKVFPLSITQKAETIVFTTDKNTADVPASGASVVVAVEYNTPYKVDIPTDAIWITEASSKAVATANVTLSVAENKNDQPRQAVVSLVPSSGSSKTITISQAAAAPSAGEGDGTEASPYLISNLDELLEFQASINDSKTNAAMADKYYKLTASIDLSSVGNFTPVGAAEATPFKGHFDGNGQTIAGLKINNTASVASGFFGYLDGASVGNFNLSNVDFNSDYVYSGAVAGHIESSTVENVTVTGKVRAYKSSLSVAACEYAPVASNNSGYNGSIVGIALRSTVKECRFDGDATFYGKFCGGIVGVSFNSTIENCSYAKDRILHIYYHYTGGIVGRALGADNVIKGCSFEGQLNSTGYVNGGIVGQLLGGRVDSCVFGSYGYVGGDKFFVAGIAGSAQPMENIVINNCASYGRVRGAYSVAGILGYAGSGSGASTDKDLMLGSAAVKDITISNCASIGCTLTATSGNGSKYPIVGGIVAWSHNKVANYNLRGCYSLPGLIETTYGDNVNGVLCGISSYQNNSGTSTIENCYSAYTVNDMLVCGNQAAANTSLWYAGVAIRCTQPTTVRNVYSESSMRTVYTSSSATLTGDAQFSIAEMTGGALLAKLQETAVDAVWVAGADGYPTLQNLPQDPNVKPKAAKKVSVIGDSISTFRGWIPGGYSSHYPAADGTLTLVNETYWYRLVHDYMKNAEVDVNIAFSGSTVTNTTTENYTAKYGSTVNAWWHNSFSERFAACGGCGNPDIILIHGGTNDWAHNADPLAPGVAIRNESGNSYGGEAPSESVMSAIYSVADAAKTRSEINALPDGTFCEAYVKLLSQIRERYPSCKVVCIIGDYLSQSVEKSVLLMAEHYGAKTVNLFRVNGFNDLGGYTESTLSNKGTQPNMPKHDYSGDISGCHPGSQAMDFIANKIYTELGTWLEN